MAWALGWLLSKASLASSGEVQRLRIVLASVVTGVWLVGYGFAYYRAAPTPKELTGLMALVLGWAYAGYVRDTIKRKLREVVSEDKDDDDE